MDPELKLKLERESTHLLFFGYKLEEGKMRQRSKEDFPQFIRTSSAKCPWGLQYSQISPRFYHFWLVKSRSCRREYYWKLLLNPHWPFHNLYFSFLWLDILCSRFVCLWDNYRYILWMSINFDLILITSFKNYIKILRV